MTKNLYLVIVESTAQDNISRALATTSLMSSPTGARVFGSYQEAMFYFEKEFGASNPFVKGSVAKVAAEIVTADDDEKAQDTPLETPMGCCQYIAGYLEGRAGFGRDREAMLMEACPTDLLSAALLPRTYQKWASNLADRHPGGWTVEAKDLREAHKAWIKSREKRRS